MRLGLPLLMTGPLAAGCTGAVSAATSPGDAETSVTTNAIVIVERMDAEDGSRAEASARFIRVAASSSASDALRAIGASSRLPARGSCASLSSLSTDLAADEPAPVVELADVGAVALEATGSEASDGRGLSLIPRQLPDVTDVVSGVVYARAADPGLLPAEARYVLHVGGAAELHAFDVVAWAPADPANVRVGGQSAGAPLVATGASIDITWMADGTADLVYLDVQPAQVRCVLGDGQGGAGDSLRASLSTSLLDDAGTIIVHRLHREPMRATGIEGGEIRFDFARSMAYVRH